MKNKLKYLITATLIIVFSLGLTVSASAQTSIDAEEYEAKEENLLSKIYAQICEYSGEILAAMTFAGSLILAFAYKKGLLPIVKTSLLSIGNALGKMKDSVSENAEMGKALGEKLECGLEKAKEVIDGLGDKVDALELALSEKLSEESEKERFKFIMQAQIDMLYDIFMSSALPQYQKDAVGERIAEMKGALAEDGKEY